MWCFGELRHAAKQVGVSLLAMKAFLLEEIGWLNCSLREQARSYRVMWCFGELRHTAKQAGASLLANWPVRAT